MLGCSSPLAASALLFEQHAEGCVCRVLAFALLRREAFADTSLNYWDEALGYIATAALLDVV
jgi:hypothetical protein